MALFKPIVMIVLILFNIKCSQSISVNLDEPVACLRIGLFFMCASFPEAFYDII